MMASVQLAGIKIGTCTGIPNMIRLFKPSPTIAPIDTFSRTSRIVSGIGVYIYMTRLSLLPGLIAHFLQGAKCCFEIQDETEADGQDETEADGNDFCHS